MVSVSVRLSIAVCALVASATATAGPILGFRDDYNISAGSYSRTTTGSGGSGNFYPYAISRQILLDEFYNGKPGTTGASVALGNGTFDFASDSGVIGQWSIYYQYDNVSPLDLTGSTGFLLSVRSNDVACDVGLWIRDTKNRYSYYSGHIGIGTGFYVPIAFDSGDADPSHIEDLRIYSDYNGSTHTSLGGMTSVPGPAALLSFGAGAVSAVRRRRRAA